MKTINDACSTTSSVFRTYGFSWPLLIGLFSLAAVLMGQWSDALLRDPDTYWHLAAGRWILEHRVIPDSDPFSHSMPGAPWTAHEWLAELIFTLVHQIAGWTGLVVLVALIFTGTLAYLLRFLLARMEPIHALLLTAFAASMLAAYMLVRPHILVWPLLAVWVGALVDAGERGRSPPWWTLLLMILWANLHGSFVLGLGLGGALALDAVVTTPASERRHAAMCWGSFVGMALLLALITPWGWHSLSYPFQVSDMDFALKVIGEWRSPDFQRIQILEVWLMLILAVACSGRMRLPLLRLILVLGLAHLALKHQRHISILGLVSPFLIAAPFATAWRSTKGTLPDAQSLDRIFSALALPARRGSIAVAGLLATLMIGGAVQSRDFSPEEKISPVAAVDGAIRAGATGKVLNSYHFGGYLIYRGIPVFIDGRADMYGDPLLKRYGDAMGLTDTDTLEQLLGDYDIGWTLLAPGTPALALLDRLPGWKRVYADDVAVVHVRESAGPSVPEH